MWEENALFSIFQYEHFHTTDPHSLTPAAPLRLLSSRQILLVGICGQRLMTGLCCHLGSVIIVCLMECLQLACIQKYHLHEVASFVFDCQVSESR
jgi:hypothetical protein